MQRQHALGKWLRTSGRVLRVPLEQRWLVTSALVVSIGIAGTLATGALVPEAWTHLANAVLERTGLRQLSEVSPPRPSSTRPSPTVATTKGAPSETRIWFGDRLKITFLETVSVVVDGTADNQGGIATTVFPRIDLSGDFLVDERGGIDVPKLGRFSASQRTMTDLQSQLAESFHRLLGRPGDVHIAVLDRQPVYVSGMVRTPGTYKYAVGMIVLQALAGAGGAGIEASDTSKAIEIIRETERLHTAQDRSDRLLVKRAMLIAERENTETMDTPKNFVAPRTENWIDPVMSAAHATLAGNRRSRFRQLAQANLQLAGARAEVTAQTTRATQLGDVIAKKQARLRELEAVAARGSVPQFRIADAMVEIAELVARQDDFEVSIVQAQGRLDASEAAVAAMEHDYTAELDKAVVSTEQELGEYAQTIGSTKAVISVLGGGVPTSGGGEQLAIRITRRGGDGFTVIVARETTALLPGDVVQVTTAASAGGPASTIASLPPK